MPKAVSLHSRMQTIKLLRRYRETLLSNLHTLEISLKALENPKVRSASDFSHVVSTGIKPIDLTFISRCLDTPLVKE